MHSNRVRRTEDSHSKAQDGRRLEHFAASPHRLNDEDTMTSAKPRGFCHLCGVVTLMRCVTYVGIIVDGRLWYCTIIQTIIG